MRFAHAHLAFVCSASGEESDNLGRNKADRPAVARKAEPPISAGYTESAMVEAGVCECKIRSMFLGLN